MKISFPGSISEREAGFTVKWVGAQRNVLQGDISGHITLSSLSSLQNLYAVGPAERLQGEVSIFDSVPSISRITGSAIHVDTDFKVNACFLVYAQVNTWRRITIPTAIGDEAALETSIVKFASELGIDVGQPFPFLDQRDTGACDVPHSRQARRPSTQPPASRKAKVRSCSGENPSRSWLLFESAPWDLYSRRYERPHAC